MYTNFGRWQCFSVTAATKKICKKEHEMSQVEGSESDKNEICMLEAHV
jgi:hypothetical protein